MRRMEYRDLPTVPETASQALWSYGVGSCITASKPTPKVRVKRLVVIVAVALVAYKGYCVEADTRTAYNSNPCVQTRFGDCEERP